MGPRLSKETHDRIVVLAKKYPQKSPMYPQKSPMYLQKSLIYPQKSPVYPPKIRRCVRIGGVSQKRL